MLSAIAFRATFSISLLTLLRPLSINICNQRQSVVPNDSQIQLNLCSVVKSRFLGENNFLVI